MKGERADLLSGLGEAYFGQSRFAEAIQTWWEGIELYSSLGSESQRGMARLYARSARAISEVGDWPGSLKLCEQGLAALAGAPESREMALLLHEAGRTSFFNGFPEQARLFCQQALAIAERLGALDVQADTLATYGVLDGLSAEEAFEALKRAVEIAETSGLLRIAARAHGNLGVTIGEIGMDPHGGFEQYLRSVEIFRKIGDVHIELFALRNLLAAAMSQGELAYAEQRLPEYERLMSTLSDPTASILGLKMLKVQLAARQGHLWEALHLARDLEAEILEREAIHGQCNWYCLLGEIILELQRLGEAVDLAAAEAALTKGIEISNQIGQFQVWTHCLFCLIRVRQGKVKEAALFLNKAGEFAGQSPTIRDQMWLKYAQAELSTTKKRWDEAIEAFDISSRLLTQAELRPMLAQVLSQKADAHIARGESGDLERARTLLLEAQELYEYMGSTPYVEFVKEKLKDLEEN